MVNEESEFAGVGEWEIQGISLSNSWEIPVFPAGMGNTHKSRDFANPGNVIVLFYVQGGPIHDYPPQTLFVGGYTVFTLSERTTVRVSVTFCFLNILKNH